VSAATAQPPNILLVMADQLAPQYTGAYDHALVKTPHMDELAARGMRFDAAYCNSPLCAPSRFSMMSGQLISRIAAYDNASEFPASVPSFAHYLRQMGYHTSLAGKMHFVGPDQLHGFEERLTTDIYPADHAWTPDWEMPDERIDKWYHNMDAVREAGVATTTFQYEYDEESLFLARRRLFEYAMHKSGPFAMVASFIHPHDPYVARPEWWTLYDDIDIELPVSEPGDDAHTLRLMHGIEADKVKVSDEEVRRARHGYFANVSYFDHQLGVLIKTLKETDLYDNTVVIVTADHGDMLGERGLWYKMNLFEHAARVPLIIAGPQVQTGKIEAPVSLVDLLPTMLDIAASEGCDTPTKGMPIDGDSLWPQLVAQHDADAERVVVAEYCAECASHPLLMLRRGQYKYIHCAGDPPQLFDVIADPYEQNNLSGQQAFAAIETNFASIAAKHWDSDKVREHVIATQRQRRAVHAAMEKGLLTSWDYQPKRDASQEFVRNHMDWTIAAQTKRYPAIEDADALRVATESAQSESKLQQEAK